MVILGNVSNRHKTAILFFSEYILSPQLVDHLQIRLSYKKLEDSLGTVIVEEYNNQNKARHFTIEIDKDLTDDEQIRTLAHEMVHLKQYAYGELNEEMTVWCGKKVDSDAIPYNSQPWEIEAFGIGDILYEEFMNEYRHYKFR